MAATRRAANDPALYDDLVDEWWRERGAFAPLHWLADARAVVIPPAVADGAVLLDIACGGGLLAPRLVGKGYRHVGVDISPRTLSEAKRHGVTVLRGDVQRLPVADASVDVVVAGEIFEHVADLAGVVREVARVLRPGGLLVCDTLAATWRCRFLLVTLGERLPIVPRGVHDPSLFVDAGHLRRLCAGAGIDLALWGLRPAIGEAAAWLVRRRASLTMRRTRSLGLVYQGVGVRSAGRG
jgi:2-polyprenyl-6-hydroxyphenyl methylase/3-demethylubiquinone-9 3-methyltransferase